MKSWEKWCLAVLLSIGASSAFADGSCQPGFSPRSYPFYDKTGAYIGMRQACAPIPCTPGYQDSTCAVPLRNGAIPQPQCQTGAGWTTVAAAVWQGSRWSAPQCNYSAPPSCPPDYDMVGGPSWTGASWTQPTCKPHFTPPPPVVIDPNVVCTAAANSHTMTDFDNEVFKSVDQSMTRNAPFRADGLWRDWSTIPGKNPNYPYGVGYRGDVVFYGLLSGPWYNKQNACSQQNRWESFCYVNPSTGGVDFFWVNTTGAGSGQCNH